MFNKNEKRTNNYKISLSKIMEKIYDNKMSSTIENCVYAISKLKKDSPFAVGNIICEDLQLICMYVKEESTIFFALENEIWEAIEHQPTDKLIDKERDVVIDIIVSGMIINQISQSMN